MSQRTIRLIALVLAIGLISGMGAPYLIQAGFSVWAVLLLVLIVLAIPVTAVLYAERSRR
ncbi:hypothetical protein OU415_03670 [Saccharopolyspora sp. WRP15-2]|uniref:Uncharacterized protein n=2 Tax=Saccharopolyspora TaxID=1835 RepID=A0ABT4US49_9PSEU|nr:hypothetical protein [Saccharopolyspora oryzae]MDA3624522.1 hypothetical protein [Saccharopolyspora oryzae]